MTPISWVQSSLHLLPRPSSRPSFATADLLGNPATAAIIDTPLPHTHVLRVELDLDAKGGPAVVGVGYAWSVKE